MSTPRPLTCTWTMPDAHTGCIVLDGDLDFDNADQLLYEVTERLSTTQGLRELRLDCGALSFCDSYGLSTLLMVQRKLHEARVALRVENRRHGLDRLLRRTNTLALFTGEARLAEQSSDPS